MAKLTHVDSAGNARMVDVGAKPVTRREARARARVCMEPNTLAMIEKNAHAKGDVLAVARIAGIQGAKRCSDLIPLCHPMMLESVAIEFRFDREKSAVQIEGRCRVSGQTGVEMEALTGVSVAALTIYDMCKAVDRGMTIEGIALVEKSGGKSGHWVRED